jgi:tape measure domain-containing protein
MAIRTDQVQLQIDFITDESRNFAKTLNATKQFNQEIDKSKAKIKQYEQELSRASTSEAKRVELLGKIAAEEKKVAAGLASIAAEGKKVEAIDLTKLTPAQLTQRAKQIEQSLRQMSQTAPAFKQLQGELAKVNGQLANIKSNSKGIQLERAASGGGGGGLSGLISLAGRAGPIIGTAIAAVGSLGAALKGASNAEQLQISFETFLGSAERAKRAIADLKGFEKNTPFDAEQVNSAGRALLAFGTAQEDLIPTLRQIGDIASGTGKDFNELTLIYGKAQAQGLIQGEELNQLAEAGIPIYAELAKQLGVNESQIRKLGSEGKISFKDLQGVFQNLTEEGGRFAGLTEKQSKSLGGLFSTLQSSLGEVLTKLGSVLAPVIKQFLEQLIPAIEKFGPVVVDVFKTVIGFFQGYGEAVNFIVNRTLQAVDRVVLNTQLAIDKTKAFFGDVEAGNRANETKKKLDKLYEDAGGGVVESFLRGFNKAFEDNKEALGDLGPGGGKAGGIITPKLTPEQIAERINKAIEVELKAIELGALKREVILGDFRAKDQISEARYQVGLVAIQEQSLEKQLEAYKRYGQDQTAEALKIQKDLQKLQSEQGERGFGIDNFGTLGQAGTGGVQRQGGNDGGQVGRDLASDALQEQLRSKFEAALITEGEYNVQRLELQRMFLQQEIDLMKGATVVQTDEIRKRE